MNPSPTKVSTARLAAVHPVGVLAFSACCGVLAVAWALAADLLGTSFAGIYDAAPTDVGSMWRVDEQTWFAAAFGKPWMALAIGIVVGLVWAVPLKRWYQRNTEQIVSRVLRKQEGPRLDDANAFPGESVLIGIVTIVTFAIAAAVGISIKVVMLAAFVPLCLIYPEWRRIFRKAVDQAAASLDATNAARLRRSLARYVWALRIVSVSILAGLVGFLAVQWPTIQEMRWNGYESRGWSISESTAEEYERDLKAHPDEIKKRLALIGFYRFSPVGREQREKAYPHAFWLIEYKPKIAHAVTFGGLFSRGEDPKKFEHAKALWLAHVSDNPENPEVLFAAADFLMYRDIDEAAALFARAKEHAGEGSALSDAITSRQAELAARRLQRERESS